MGKETVDSRILRFVRGNRGYARMKDFKEASFRMPDIRRLVEAGDLVKIKPGLYRPADLEYPKNVSLGFIDVARSFREGVICLLSALAHHELTTHNPARIQVAIPHQQNRVKMVFPPVDVFYFRGRLHDSGRDVLKTRYGDVAIYGPEKTICDLFRYRRKFGEDVAVEGLKNYLRRKSADLGKLREYAEICQVKLVITPYIKALVG
jgi:predicted transcriptional regulator of viral defense system